MAERFSQMMPDRQSRQANQTRTSYCPRHPTSLEEDFAAWSTMTWATRFETMLHQHATPLKWVPGQVRHGRCPTTSFLTATTLIYANGAGITAAAGTRLALHWILVKVFKLYSFQLPNHIVARYCYFLSLPPCVRIG